MCLFTVHICQQEQKQSLHKCHMVPFPFQYGSVAWALGKLMCYNKEMSTENHSSFVCLPLLYLCLFLKCLNVRRGHFHQNLCCSPNRLKVMKALCPHYSLRLVIPLQELDTSQFFNLFLWYPHAMNIFHPLSAEVKYFSGSHNLIGLCSCQ